MTAEPPPDVAGGAEEVLATTQLQVRALGLTGALMQNITAIAPAITAFFFTATIVGFTGAISPFAYFLGFLIVLALGLCLVQQAVPVGRRILHLREPDDRGARRP
jgi:hypothetical protein